MLNVSKRQLVRQRYQIRNPSDQSLTLVIEPWSDEFELAIHESVEIVFIGPKNGQLEETRPCPGRLKIYGWDGSEFVAFREGRLAIPSPSVKDIIRQEYQIAERKIQLSSSDWPAEVIEFVNHKLDFSSEMTIESQEFVCSLASQLVCKLAATVDASDESTELLWRIADRAVGRAGILLAAPGRQQRRRVEEALWEDQPKRLFTTIWHCAVSACHGPFDLADAASRRARLARRQSAE